MFEQEWHCFTQHITFCNQQTAIQYSFRQQQFFLLYVKFLIHSSAHGILQYFRTHLPRSRSNHHRRIIAVCIHKAQSHHTVEPCVSHFFYHSILTFDLNPLFQFGNLCLISTQFCSILSKYKLQACSYQLQKFYSCLLCKCL